jgi:hypothetical protein
MASDEARVLVIRVWREPDRSPSFRARVVSVTPDGDRVEYIGVTTSAEVVERWLRSWLVEAPPPATD